MKLTRKDKAVYWALRIGACVGGIYPPYDWADEWRRYLGRRA